ncbi:MAG: FAD-dependent monooxygenase, partial [Ferruginibacter sp.]
MEKNIGIIGAGLVGSLLSVFLSKRGYNVTIFERRPDIRKAVSIEGRSINLALSDRGIRALEQVGIMNEILHIAIPMHGRKMHNSDGSTAYQPYGNNRQYINSVSRGQLNIMLMN